MLMRFDPQLDRVWSQKGFFGSKYENWRLSRERQREGRIFCANETPANFPRERREAWEMRLLENFAEKLSEVSSYANANNTVFVAT